MSETPIKKPSCLKSCLIASAVLCSILAAFLCFFIPYARNEARQMQCVNHCKQLALMFHNYHSVYGCFPPAYTVDENGKPLHSWRVLFLPFMYQQRLYSDIRLDEPWDSEHNRQFHDQMPSIFSCPNSPYYNKKYCTNYLRIVGPGTLTDGPKTVSSNDITGRTCTILFVESARPVCWMAPEDLAFEDFKLDDTDSPLPGHDDVGIGSFHPHKINIALCDGSVLSVPDDLPIRFLAAAARAQMKKDE